MTTKSYKGPEFDLRWGQEDPAPYMVSAPRIPCVGERIIGPGNMAIMVVTDVTFVYEEGFYFEPRVVVVTSYLDKSPE